MTLSSPEAEAEALAARLELPCGVVLRNRLVKAPMSDCLGDGAGRPTDAQVALYRRWAAGGVGLSLVGEVQVDPRYPENPGNLVLGPGADERGLRRLAEAGSAGGALIWPQLGHAGALAHSPTSHPAGPSALDLPGLRCGALTAAEVDALPAAYGRAAARAQAAGFTGVQVHAGHGFLLSQFLSPLFNRRTDQHGGSIEARSRLLLSVVREVRAAVGPRFALGVKINSSDQLVGGLDEDDALVVIGLLGQAGVDLVEITAGTYFPGAPASSDRPASGPYYVDFARRARTVTGTPLMLTGGFRTRREAALAVASGASDAVGIARAMVLDPDLAARWLDPEGGDPQFPRFASPPPGGVTAWYTMRLAALARGEEDNFDPSPAKAAEQYESRDAERVGVWRRAFAAPPAPSSAAAW